MPQATSMQDIKKEVAVKFLTSMGHGDAVGVAACLAPDAITMARNFSKFAGINHREQILGMVGSFRSLMPDGLKFTIFNVSREGDSVTIECDGDAVTRAGTPYRNQYCFVFRFSGEKIQEIHEYFCSKLAEEILLPLISA